MKRTTEYDCLDCGREFHSSEATSFCSACEARHDANADAIVVIIPGRKISDYLRLKALGYVTLWSGEGMICLRAPKDGLERASEPLAPRVGREPRFVRATTNPLDERRTVTGRNAS